MRVMTPQTFEDKLTDLISEGSSGGLPIFMMLEIIELQAEAMQTALDEVEFDWNEEDEEEE